MMSLWFHLNIIKFDTLVNCKSFVNHVCINKYNGVINWFSSVPIFFKILNSQWYVCSCNVRIHYYIYLKKNQNI